METRGLGLSISTAALFLVAVLSSSSACASDLQLPDGQTKRAGLAVTLRDATIINAPRLRDTNGFVPNTEPIVRDQNGRFVPRDDGVKRSLVTDNKIASTDGGELTRGLANVVVDQHGLCRWVDNNDEASDYFIPTGSAEEWAAFVANAPAKVRVDACCPAKTVILTASDGQSAVQTLDIGRENSTGDFGRRTLTYAFGMSRPSDGARWTETVSETFTCQNGEWTSMGATTSGGAPGTWTYGSWGECSATCGGGTQTRKATCVVGGAEADVAQCAGEPTTETTCGQEACVSCEPQTFNIKSTWSGRWRRGNSRVNQTIAAAGFSEVRMRYIQPGNAVVISSGGDGERSVAHFTLRIPAKNTHVKVTAVYDTNGGAAAWSANRRPKVAEFDIAEGQTIGQFNAPSVSAFYRHGDMGHPFMMVNNAIFMPTYDNAPDLLSLVVEYQATLVPDACKAVCGADAGTCNKGTAGSLSTTCTSPYSFTYGGQVYNLCLASTSKWSCAASQGMATAACNASASIYSRF